MVVKLYSVAGGAIPIYEPLFLSLPSCNDEVLKLSRRPPDTWIISLIFRKMLCETPFQVITASNVDDIPTSIIEGINSGAVWHHHHIKSCKRFQSDPIHNC